MFSRSRWLSVIIVGMSVLGLGLGAEARAGGKVDWSEYLEPAGSRTKPAQAPAPSAATSAATKAATKKSMPKAPTASRAKAKAPARAARHR